MSKKKADWLLPTERSKIIGMAKLNLTGQDRGGTPIVASRRSITSAKAVLRAISDHMHRGNHAYPGMGTIAELAGMDRSTVIRVIRKLVQAGYLRKGRREGSRKGRDCNVYEIDWDLLSSAQTSGDPPLVAPPPTSGDETLPTSGDETLPTSGNETPMRPYVAGSEPSVATSGDPPLGSGDPPPEGEMKGAPARKSGSDRPGLEKMQSSEAANLEVIPPTRTREEPTNNLGTPDDESPNQSGEADDAPTLGTPDDENPNQHGEVNDAMPLPTHEFTQLDRLLNRYWKAEDPGRRHGYAIKLWEALEVAADLSASDVKKLDVFKTRLDGIPHDLPAGWNPTVNDLIHGIRTVLGDLPDKSNPVMAVIITDGIWPNVLCCLMDEWTMRHKVRFAKERRLPGSYRMDLTDLVRDIILHPRRYPVQEPEPPYEAPPLNPEAEKRYEEARRQSWLRQSRSTGPTYLVKDDGTESERPEWW